MTKGRADLSLQICKRTSGTFQHKLKSFWWRQVLLSEVCCSWRQSVIVTKLLGFWEQQWWKTISNTFFHRKLFANVQAYQVICTCAKCLVLWRLCEQKQTLIHAPLLVHSFVLLSLTSCGGWRPSCHLTQASSTNVVWNNVWKLHKTGQDWTWAQNQGQIQESKGQSHLHWGTPPAYGHFSFKLRTSLCLPHALCSCSSGLPLLRSRRPRVWIQKTVWRGALPWDIICRSPVPSRPFRGRLSSKTWCWEVCATETCSFSLLYYCVSVNIWGSSSGPGVWIRPVIRPLGWTTQQKSSQVPSTWRKVLWGDPALAQAHESGPGCDPSPGLDDTTKASAKNMKAVAKSWANPGFLVYNQGSPRPVKCKFYSIHVFEHQPHFPSPVFTPKLSKFKSRHASWGSGLLRFTCQLSVDTPQRPLCPGPAWDRDTPHLKPADVTSN